MGRGFRVAHASMGPSLNATDQAKARRLGTSSLPRFNGAVAERDGSAGEDRNHNASKPVLQWGRR